MAPYSWRGDRHCQSGFHLTRDMKCRISARFEKAPQRGGADPNQVLGPAPSGYRARGDRLMTRAIRALSIALAVLFAVGAPAAWAQDAVKVGVIEPLSGPVAASGNYRSEEHTSELQSQFHLVCRLLLEKKKKKHK